VPRLIWLGVEPLVKQNAALALDRASDANIPLVARFIARRAVDADAVDALVAAIDKAPKTRVSLLEGMRDGLEGRFDLAPPRNWESSYERLKTADAGTARLASEIAEKFGDAEAVRRTVATVSDRAAAIDQRQRALHVLASQRRPQLIAQLPALLDDERLRLDAIRAIAAYDRESLGKLLLQRYPSLTPAEKAEAIQTFASRPTYGRLLTAAIANGSVPKSAVPPHAARQLLRVVGTRFADAWGPVERSSTEERAYARYRGLLNETMLSGANPQSGRAVFQRTCGACHMMYGEGGTIGPDLTGSNRANLSYLLLNVLEPNAEVPDAYKMVVVTTRDGRTYSGNVAAETDRQLTLRVIGRDAVVVNKADVQSREATATSMMPPGLFDALSDREVIDLVGYLQTAAKAP
jgi:putative heme-binding domain-containing protein